MISNCKHVVLTALPFVIFNSHAQSPEQKAMFPEANVAIVFRKCLVYEEGRDTLAESDYSIQMMMLTDKNSNMISRYGFNTAVTASWLTWAYTKVPSEKII